MPADQNTYTVRPGDSMGKIATHYGLSLGALLRANPQISNPNLIHPTQVINIPTGAAAAPPQQFPNTSNTPEAQKYDSYAPFLAQQKVSLDQFAPGERVILGLRVQTNTGANRGLGLYDDRIVVAWRDADGTKHAREFSGTTEPSAYYQGRFGKDANGDGSKDLGSLDNGVYKYRKARAAHYGNILCPIDDIDVMRDIDHDGDFDQRDKDGVKIKSALDSKLSILFHKGGTGMTGSAGCQTMRPADFNRFWESLGGQQDFKYVLVTLK